MEKSNYFIKKRMLPYMLISPFFILFLIFGLYPIGYSFVLSFLKFSRGKSEFVGLYNYTLMLTQDPYFWKSLKNTGILLVFGTMLQHVFAIPLAVLLNSKLLKGREFFKTAFFLPFITSTVSVVIIFTRIFSENYGIINYVLTEFLHLEAVKWINDPTAIKATLSVMINWKWIGWNTIIYLAGLQSIDEQLYEASALDGASPRQQFFKITIPLLAPIIFFATTMSIIGGMQLFDEPYVLLGGYELMGGTGNSGMTTAFYILTQGMRWLRFGKASAISWILFVFIAIMSIVNRYANKLLDNE